MVNDNIISRNFDKPTIVSGDIKENCLLENTMIGGYGTTSTKDGHVFPSVFSYSKYAARLFFSKKDNSKFDGYWLETLRNTMSNHAWIIYATARRIHSVKVNKSGVLIGVRPVIEISKNDISY